MTTQKARDAIYDTLYIGTELTMLRVSDGYMEESKDDVSISERYETELYVKVDGIEYRVTVQRNRR